MKYLLSSLVFSLFFLASCQQQTQEQTTEQQAMTEAEEQTTSSREMEDVKVWRLQSYGEPGQMQEVADDVEITLTMDLKNNTVTGKAVCNNYTGRLASMDTGMGINDVVATTEPCPEELEPMQDQYLDMLSLAADYEISEGKLTMTLEDGRKLIFSS